MIRKKERPGGTSISTSEYLPKPIQDLDLGPIRFKLMSDESPVDWTEEFSKVVEEEYRKFLALTYESNGGIIVPDGMIDVFWHQHILDTEKYEEDCREIFGRFIHHFPYFGLRGEDDKRELEDSFKKTVEQYTSRFGTPPKNMWAFPADCGRTGCGVGSDPPRPSP